MNGENQPQQEMHRTVERIARVETAIDYQGKAIDALREEMRMGFDRLEAQMREGFARVDKRFEQVDKRFEQIDRQFERVHEQIDKVRTTDFRILLSICLTTAFGTLGLIFKALGLFQAL